MLPIQSSNIQNPALLTMDVSTTAHLVRALSSQGPHHRPTLYSVPSHRQGLHHRPTLYSVLPSQLTLMMFIFFFFWLHQVLVAQHKISHCGTWA